MQIASTPRSASKRVRIVQLTPEALAALAAGDLSEANRHSPVRLGEFFVSARQDAVWQRRSRQVLEHPESAAWITGVVWDEDQELAVGRAGFHGPPDEHGTVEVGYEIAPELRRQGYARAAFEALLNRAIADPAIATLRATIAPDNLPSYHLVQQYGLERVGEQWDEKDGLEIIYELTVRSN